MQARIIGPEDELGEVNEYRPLNFFGNKLHRKWSDISVAPAQLEKLKGNRYVDLREGGRNSDATKADVAADPDAGGTPEEADSIRSRLDELGVEYAPAASLKVLRIALDKAEKAKAEADEDGQGADA